MASVATASRPAARIRNRVIDGVMMILQRSRAPAAGMSVRSTLRYAAGYSATPRRTESVRRLVQIVPVMNHVAGQPGRPPEFAAVGTWPARRFNRDVASHELLDLSRARASEVRANPAFDARLHPLRSGANGSKLMTRSVLMAPHDAPIDV
jgi:hypothetical protein